jgi:hypothetical protein
MGKKLVDIQAGQRNRMSPADGFLFMKVEKIGIPLNVSGFGADRHMAQAHQLLDLVQ